MMKYCGGRGGSGCKSVTEEYYAMLINEPNVNWVANKKLDISNFNFNFPRARNIEILRYYRQTFQGSFSAVSKPKFASKYSLVGDDTSARG